MRLLGAPALLVLVAMCQRYFMHRFDLDPWKGGGFGMFSAMSDRSLRQMTITLVDADGKQTRFPPLSLNSRLPLDGDMAWIARELKTMPHPTLLQDLADRLAAAEWVAVRPVARTDGETAPRNESAKPVVEGAGGEERSSLEYYRMRSDVQNQKNVATRPLLLQEIKVEIWQYNYDHQANQLFLTLVRAATARP